MFVELVIVEERQRAEALSDALLDAGALSASIEDADAGSVDEQPLYGEPGMAAPASGLEPQQGRRPVRRHDRCGRRVAGCVGRPRHHGRPGGRTP